MLTPVVGFTVPEEDQQKYRILDIPVGTDAFLVTKTRREAGSTSSRRSKTCGIADPSSPNGSVAILEDWFDPRRLRPHYVQAGTTDTTPPRALLQAMRLA